MRKVEVKKLGIASVLKSTLYVYFIPIILIIFSFILLTLVGVTIEGADALLSIPVFLFIIIIYTGIYAAVITLMTVCYNWLAGKFGGLIMTVQDHEQELDKIPYK